MDILKYKGFEGSAELDMERAVCRGKLLFIDDLVTYEAATPPELQREFEAAVDDYIATCAVLGREPKKPLKGQFNVRVPPQLHAAAARKARADGVSLNDVVVRALDALINGPADINHHHEVLVTLQTGEDVMETAFASASENLHWSTRSVTH